MEIKKKSNESEYEAICKHFGLNWKYAPIESLVHWSNIGEYYVDIIVNDKEIRVDIKWSSLPNITKIFKNLVKRKSLVKRKPVTSSKKQVIG